MEKDKEFQEYDGYSLPERKTLTEEEIKELEKRYTELIKKIHAANSHLSNTEK